MILHIEFIDRSNPWVTFGDIDHCKKAWKKWSNNPDARPLFMCGELKCRMRAPYGWSVGRYFDGAHTCKNFEYLGNALKYMERMEKMHNE